MSPHVIELRIGIYSMLTGAVDVKTEMGGVIVGVEGVKMNSGISKHLIRKFEYSIKRI